MPYCWDDDSDFDRSSSDSAAYSFADARKTYDDVAVAKTEASIIYDWTSPFPKTDAPYPIVVGIDTTGSMREWPEVFFEKLPLLYKEANKYYPECEFSFQAINDWFADGEKAALQPAPFAKGAQLDEIIGQLYPHGGGGGQTMESYEIFAAYNSFLEAPGARIKPIAIILGDEAPFEYLPRKVGRHYGLARIQKVPASDVFARLHESCDVFLIRKPYWGFGKRDRPIIRKWEAIAHMTPDRIMNIQDPRRVVDVILGVMGILTGRADEFEAELTRRQTSEQADEVLNSLHGLRHSRHTGQSSVSRGLGQDGEKTSGLDIDG